MVRSLAATPLLHLRLPLVISVPVHHASPEADFEDVTAPPSLPPRSCRRPSRNLHAAAAHFISPDDHFSSASHKAHYHDIVVQRPMLIEDNFSLSDLGIAFTHFIT
ncbi:hypothetical protein GBA52_003738 [Prunus armeniaca]|nr:hypothetical protein GBA52_003738 [Prunus armeniaca]